MSKISMSDLFKQFEYSTIRQLRLQCETTLTQMQNISAMARSAAEQLAAVADTLEALERHLTPEIHAVPGDDHDLR